MKKQLYTTALLLALPAMLCCQQMPAEKWNKRFGGNRYDDFQMAIETIEGGIAAVGNTRSKAYRNNDVLLVVTDENGGEMLNVNFGGTADDGASAIVQAFDGGYVIAGYTASPWKEAIGERDAWLLKVSELGIVIWDKVLGTVADDELHDLLQMADGSFVATGSRDGHLYLVKIDANGSLGWEFVHDQKLTNGVALAQLPDGDFIVAGNAGASGKEMAFLIKIKQDGSGVVWQKGWYNWQSLFKKDPPAKAVSALVAKDLVVTPTADIALAGTASIDGHKTQAFYLRTNEQGDLLCFGHYGQKGEEGGEAIVQTPSGDFLLAGYGSPFSGANRSSFWMNYVQPNGNSLWDAKPVDASSKNIFGDRFHSLAQLHDGELIAAGHSDKLTTVDAYLTRFERLGTPTMDGKPLVSITKGGFVDQDGNGILDPVERGYYSFTLTNEGDGDAWGINARIEALSIADGVHIARSLSIGHLPKNASQKVAIPISATEGLLSGSNKFTIVFEATNGLAIPSFDFEVTSRKEPMPRLETIGYRFSLPEGKPLRRSEVHQLEIELKNTGDAPAEDVYFRFSLPDYVAPTDSLKQSLGTLQPGELRKLSIRFKASSLFQSDTLEVDTKAWEKTRRNGTNGSYRLLLPSIRDDVEPTGIVPEPTDRGGKRGPSNGWMSYAPTDIMLTWVSPDMTELAKLGNTTNTADLTVKLRLLTKQSLEIGQVQLLLNGEPIAANKDMELLQMEDGYDFVATIKLQEGENRIQVIVTTGDYRGEKVLAIKYVQKKVNLHVYSFGVPQTDLKYSTKDAQDFANVFQGQEGDNGVFEKVYIHKFTSEQSTKEKEIAKTIQDIAYDDNIKNGDVLLLFFSSHGFISDRPHKHFKLSAANCNILYKEFQSLDFQEELLDVLKPLKTKKFIFLDACRSGGSIENNDEPEDAATKAGAEPDTKALTLAIENIFKTANDFSIMASCDKGESSFESTKWGNGAFTKALLEAFGNAELKIGNKQVRADEDGNKILTIRELYEYTKDRVPLLVKEIGPNIKQTPYMPNDQLKEPKPLYSLGHK
ncbi:MAG: caspase family protein [Saprospiraceae bacterium]|nr:caspase family protein [Saprospiraceae bacterium]MCF8251230.1 caspase family protein [Saprospiraceae bacterium]MCF8281214.1 caspase family protein [Bacteroidales bacterium]MCF8313146.1 caspase family protein [Saprospiraceae bacterium]MCF8441592.1 caspase family protein [Saprospiraceae bacterium]